MYNLTLLLIEKKTRELYGCLVNDEYTDKFIDCKGFMRVITIILFFLLSGSSFSKSCEELSQIMSLLVKGDKGNYLDQIIQATYKLAMEGRGEKVSPLTSAANESLEKLFKKEKSYQELLTLRESFGVEALSQLKARFYGQDVAAFAYARHLLEKDSIWNIKDVAAFWWIDQVELGDFNLNLMLDAWERVIQKAEDNKKKPGFFDFMDSDKKVTRANEVALQNLFLAFKKEIWPFIKKWKLEWEEEYSYCSQFNIICEQAYSPLESGDSNSSELVNQTRLVASALEEQELQQEHADRYVFETRPLASWKVPIAEEVTLPKVYWDYKTGKEDYVERMKWQKELNTKDNMTIIKEARKKLDQGHYGILDKKESRLFLYHESGTLVGQVGIKRLPSSDYRGDKAMKKKKGGGAGNYNALTISEGGMVLKDLRGRLMAIDFQGSFGPCREGICQERDEGRVNYLSQKEFVNLPIYILPTDERNQFIVKNGALAFTTFRKKIQYWNYNYSPKNNAFKANRTIIVNDQIDSDVAKKFIATLDQEKAKLMALYNLENDEYNELARLAFGILGQESEIGENFVYYLKEAMPSGVAYLKEVKGAIRKAKAEGREKGFWSGLGKYQDEKTRIEREYKKRGGLPTFKNSRGSTQIKRVPKKIFEAYGFTKETLHMADHAAVATLGFLAQSLGELKAKEKFHPEINFNTRFDYLHYIYMGMSKEIVNATGIPEHNIYYRHMRKFGEGIRIFQDETAKTQIKREKGSFIYPSPYKFKKLFHLTNDEYRVLNSW
jgi:hypothetical protein